MTSETKTFIGFIGGTFAIIMVAVIFLGRPPATYTKDDLIPKGVNWRGDQNAAVYLVEFSDFQCPACLDAKPSIDKVLKEYGDRILFAYRHFPLDQHPFSQQAALAAEAAGKQGKFWEMHDLLFANQKKLSNETVASIAASLKLDIKEFEGAVADPATKDKVFSDRAAGLRLGVNSTPTFFLNGQKMNLNSFSDLETAVKNALDQKK